MPVRVNAVERVMNLIYGGYYQWDDWDQGRGGGPDLKSGVRSPNGLVTGLAHDEIDKIANDLYEDFVSTISWERVVREAAARHSFLGHKGNDEAEFFGDTPYPCGDCVRESLMALEHFWENEPAVEAVNDPNERTDREWRLKNALRVIFKDVTSRV